MKRMSANGAFLHPKTAAMPFAICALACFAACGDDSRSESLGRADEDFSSDPCAGAPGVATLHHHGVASSAETHDGDLVLALGVDDDAVAARVPGYDGSNERAFACVPIQPGPYGNGPYYRRLDLAWAESISLPDKRVDVHRARVPIDPSFHSSAWSFSRGVYFGLRTSAGVVWAQGPGQDITVHPAATTGPRLSPLP